MEAKFEVDDIPRYIDVLKIGKNRSDAALRLIYESAVAGSWKRLPIAVDEYRFSRDNMRIEQLSVSGPDAQHDFAFEIVEAVKIGS